MTTAKPSMSKTTPGLNSSSDLRMAKLWVKFARSFGGRWSSQYGASDNGTWGLALCFVTDAAIDEAVERVIRNGGGFPPTLPEFVAMCAKAMGLPDAGTAYLDACHSRWTHDTVYETAKRVGLFELMHRSEKEMLPRFKEVFGTVCAEWMADNTKFGQPKVAKIAVIPKADYSPDVAMSALAQARSALGA